MCKQRNNSTSAEFAQSLNNNTEVICLLPRNCRKELVISVPIDVSLTRFSSIIETTLQEQLPASNIYIIKIDLDKEDTSTSTSTSTFIYEIIFMQVPKELIEKLRSGGVQTLHLYIGFSEEEKEYPILNHIPELEHIATKNRDGDRVPYNITIAI